MLLSLGGAGGRRRPQSLRHSSLVYVIAAVTVSFSKFFSCLPLFAAHRPDDSYTATIIGSYRTAHRRCAVTYGVDPSP